MSIALGVMVLLAGCNSKEKAALQQSNEALTQKLDSMQVVLEANAYQAGLLYQMGLYMDSIEANQGYISSNLETGMTEEEYLERMKRINQLMHTAEYTIRELEKNQSLHTGQMRRLKNQLAEANQQISTLQLAVAQYQDENSSLKNMLQISESALAEVQEELIAKGIDLAKAEQEIAGLVAKNQLTEAEGYFARGEGMENVANHIQLSRKRKQAAWQGALEHYTKAWELGYAPAEAKVAAMKEKLKIS